MAGQGTEQVAPFISILIMKMAADAGVRDVEPHRDLATVLDARPDHHVVIRVRPKKPCWPISFLYGAFRA